MEIKIETKHRKLPKAISISEDEYNEIINDFGSLTEFFKRAYRSYYLQKKTIWILYTLSFAAILIMAMAMIAIVATSTLPFTISILMAGGSLAMLVNAAIIFAALITKIKNKGVKNGRV